MGRTSGRSADQTKRLILDAATVVIRERGLAASLDEIAEHAGVSKGGVVYHFTSKDALVETLVRDMCDGFRSAVHDVVDQGDPDPGRLTRAYIRVCLDPATTDASTRETAALIMQLMTSPAVEQFIAEDTDRWHRDLEADGLPEATTSLVIAAAEGASMSSLWSGLGEHFDREAFARQLLAITRQPQNGTPHADG